MDDKKRSDDQEQLEAHSLPGTNQAGKTAPECGERDAANGPAEDRASGKDGSKETAPTGKDR